MHFFHGPRMDAEELKRRKITRTSLARAWAFAEPFRLLIFGYLTCIVFTSLLAIVPPLVFRRILDHAIPKRDLSEVNKLAIFLILINLAQMLLGIYTRWSSSKVGEGIIAVARKRLYDHVQRMPIAFFTRTQTGSLMSRLNSDVVGAQQAFTYILRTVTAQAMTVLFTVSVMFALSWKITAVALAVVPLLIVLTKKVGKRMEGLARQGMQLNAEMNSLMTERLNVAGAMLVKLFGNRDRESKAFSTKAEQVADVGVKRAMSAAPMFVLLPIIYAVGTAGVYWWGARSVIDGSLKIGTIVAMAAYLQRMWDPMTELANARIEFKTAFVSFERIFEVLDAPRMIDDKPGAVVLSGPGRVVFDHVGFRYPAPTEVSIASLEIAGLVLGVDPSAWVLRDIAFTAEPGTVTALVGPSGAGKSTMASLIPRLYEATEGAVRIDGLDVRDVTLDSLSAAIGVVTQDAHLFHDTIANNLRYARPGATLSELEMACRAARIHDLIASLPEGYDTMAGERGYRLSGGEKQRLAIARVLLKDPRIVVLDEATAHLDSETEFQIQEAFATALAGRTAIVIAHRLSTIQAADQILVIDKGRIIERGRHIDLVSAGGLYSELYETQYLRGANDPVAM